MSVYKVPQDVEADDKLLGPFNFRQFIYLMVAGGLIVLSIFLFQVFPGLIIIPAPFLIFFLVLALPLKKDQPMEMYLAAVLSFYLKPNKRLWQPDGVEHLIEISAPLNSDEHLTKDLARDEASRRLSYLADIVDTEGWAIKHAVAPNSNIQQDVLAEGKSANDIFENRASQIDSLLQNQNNIRKQQIMRNMNTARNLADYTNSNADQIQAQTFAAPSAVDLYADSLERAKIQEQSQYLSWSQKNPINPQPQQFSAPNTAQFSNAPQIQHFGANTPIQNSQVSNSFSNAQNLQQPTTENFENIKLEFNPYPNSMHQSVISPNGQNRQPQVQQQIQQPPVQPKPEQMNPQIMKLVSEGKDLSVETIARQAEKIRKKEDEFNLNNEEEVIISLR